MWWHPYDKARADSIRSSAKLLYGKGSQRVEALREGALPLVKVTARSFKRKG